MPTPHFYQLHSRLGLLHPPIGSTEMNLGVEEGAEAILTRNWRDFFPGSFKGIIQHSLPEKQVPGTYYAVVADQYFNNAQIMIDHFQPGQMLVAVGGDHSVALSSLQADRLMMPSAKIGVIMFDSHADLHTAATSPSGNFHGMWLRPFYTPIGVPEMDSQITSYLDPHDLMYVGNLLMEAEEERFLAEHSIEPISSQRWGRDRAASEAQLAALAARCDHLHLSFDIDVLALPGGTATGTPNPSGWSWADMQEVLAFLKPLLKSFTLDLVEVNPRKPNAELTVQVAREVLRKLLSF